MKDNMKYNIKDNFIDNIKDGIKHNNKDIININGDIKKLIKDNSAWFPDQWGGRESPIRWGGEEQLQGRIYIMNIIKDSRDIR